MYLLYLMPLYAKWHYGGGFRDLYHNWKNFISFTLHFFSIKILFSTLLAPFWRLDEEYKKEFDPESFFETLVVNTLMRLVGFFSRMFVIAIGLIVLFMVLVLGPVTLLLWALAPLAVIALFILGVFSILL